MDFMTNAVDCPTWRIKHLAEFAYDLSLLADEIAAAERPIADGPLFALWQVMRDIGGDWQRRHQQLDRYREAAWSRTWCDDLSRFAHEVLAAELLVRVLGTVLAAQDKQRDQSHARPIIEHILLAVQHARSKALELVVHAGDPVASVDRFRRRSERWTDVLVGPALARHGVAVFAHDARRAWEFGEEQLTSETGPGARRMFHTGYRAAFRDAVLDTSLSARWNVVLTSILDGLSDDGLADALLRWRDITQFQEPSPSQVVPLESEDDASGWSLLARCLRVAELRRNAEPSP
jgi:hypothetical protein